VPGCRSGPGKNKNSSSRNVTFCVSRGRRRDPLFIPVKRIQGLLGYIGGYPVFLFKGIPQFRNIRPSKKTSSDQQCRGVSQGGFSVRIVVNLKINPVAVDAHFDGLAHDDRTDTVWHQCIENRNVLRIKPYAAVTGHSADGERLVCAVNEDALVGQPQGVSTQRIVGSRRHDRR